MLKKESGEFIKAERKLLRHEDLVYLAELKKAEDARHEEIKSFEERIATLQQQIENQTANWSASRKRKTLE